MQVQYNHITHEFLNRVNLKLTIQENLHLEKITHGSSIQIQVYRRIATTSSYSYSYSKVQVIAS